MKNNLAVLRKRHGISASTLATAVGVSRQTVYAVERGTYVPNTAVSLRLARSLGVTVEEIFELSGTELKPQTVVPLTNDLEPGQAVKLCQVGGNLMAVPASANSWCLPECDTSLIGRTQVALQDPLPGFGNRLLMAGCDPALSLLAKHLRPAGIELVLTHRNSSQSLALLKQGRVHISGTHLPSNDAAIKKLFPGNSAAVVSFAIGEEGLLTALGNPKKIKGVHDLVRRGVTFINREAGSGSRALLDSHLKRSKLDIETINGYRSTAQGHLAAAREVKTGSVDCCLATESSARVFGLHFIPLESIRYDLAIDKRHLNLPAMQTLFDLISRSNFRQSLKSVGGYDTTVTGTRVR